MAAHAQLAETSGAAAPLHGVVTFEQQTANSLTITASLGGSATTTGHKWHVHTAAINESNACASGLGHYDPDSLENVAGYTCNTSSVQSSCWKGDLSGKFGMVRLCKASQ